MDKHKKPNNHSHTDRQQKRLTTAPIKQRTKYTDIYKNNNFQLPLLKGKNTTLNQRQVRKNTNTSGGKRQQIIKVQLEHQQIHKRPQTSKGSRKNYNQSQFHQDDGQDLFSTTLQQKIDMFKKNSKDIHIPVYKP